MKYSTVGQVYNPGAVVRAQCVLDDPLTDVDIKGERFLLVALTAGSLVFSRGERRITAQAPCFVCFNELENPVLLAQDGARVAAVYFHPTYLNVNMSFDFIRSARYRALAMVYDMFLLKPFLDNAFVVPMRGEFIPQVDNACRQMREELTLQRDGYWSCRGRSYLMELMLALDRMYSMVGYDRLAENADVFSRLKSPKLREAALFMEAHFAEAITLADICAAADVNHTTLTCRMKEEIGMTAMEYLYRYRVQVAKKQLEFTNVPIKDIAARTGFKTVPHFSRVFTRQIGETPAHFRKAAVQKRKDEIK